MAGEIQAKRGFTAREMCYMAISTALMAVCSWLSIPAEVPFTLQTFAVFFALLFLGGRRGTVSILAYVLLGAVGAPVFAGFSGGPGVLFGLTGGYIVGFLFTGLVYWLITRRFGEGLPACIAGLAVGLMVCYLFGTVWFMWVYGRTYDPIGFVPALTLCVVPFLPVDIIKLALAVVLSWRVKKHIQL